MVDERAAYTAAQLYQEAEMRVLARISRAIAAGLDAPDWEQRTLARLQQLRFDALGDLLDVNEKAALQIADAVDAAYTDGGAEILRDVRDTIRPIEVAAPQQRRAITRIVDEITRGVNAASSQVLRQTEDAFRDVVARTVGIVAARGESRRSAAQTAMRELFSDGLDSFTDQRGRRWNLQSYVDMAVRTGTANAQIRGHEDTLDTNGLDLVIVQPGPRACSICDKWARMVLTRYGPAGRIATANLKTGNAITVTADGTLAEARAAGFQHPNCRCRLRAFIPGVTKRADVQRPPWDGDGYKAQQQQRAIERDIRQAKIEQSIALDDEGRQLAGRKVAAHQARMRAHLAANPQLKRRSDREQVIDLRKQETTPKPVARPATRPPAPVQPTIDPTLTGTAFERLKRIPSPETMGAAAQVTNPGRSLGSAYQNNCSFVVNAVELRARGVDVVAKPVPTQYKSGRTNRDMAQDWRQADGQVRFFQPIPATRSTETRRAIERVTESWPVGARGFVSGQWSRVRAGHVFNVEKTAAGLVYHEGQRHETDSDRAGQYVDEMVPKTIALLRVDDLIPWESLKNAVEERTDEAAAALAKLADKNAARRVKLHAELAQLRADYARVTVDYRAARVRLSALVEKRSEYGIDALTFEDLRAQERALRMEILALGQQLDKWAKRERVVIRELNKIGV